MNGYICFYKEKQCEVYADTMFQARTKAAELLKVKPKDEYKISVNLAELNGKAYIQTADM